MFLLLNILKKNLKLEIRYCLVFYIQYSTNTLLLQDHPGSLALLVNEGKQVHQDPQEPQANKDPLDLEVKMVCLVLKAKEESQDQGGRMVHQVPQAARDKEERLDYLGQMVSQDPQVLLGLLDNGENLGREESLAREESLVQQAHRAHLEEMVLSI